LPETSLPYTQQEEALKIFIFDMLVQNADRGHQRANLNTNGKEFKIFDHELAFSFLGLIGKGTNESWRINENGLDKDLVFKHLFHRYLKGSKALPIDNLVESINSLDQEFWKRAEKLIPPQWMSNNFQKIKQHIQSIVENLNNFKIEIRRILS
jgi:hypothetical protein